MRPAQGVGKNFELGFVNSYGAVGNGSTNDRTAISDTASAHSTVVFTVGSYLVSTSLALTDHLVFYNGGIIKPASGQTITISGHIDAGAYQIFDTSVGGSFSLTGEAATRIRPQWFGSNDLAKAVAAIAASNKGSSIVLSGGRYTLSAQLTCALPNLNIIGEAGSGNIGSATDETTDAASIIEVDHTAGGIKFTNAYGPTIENVAFVDTSSGCTGSAIDIDAGGATTAIDGVTLRNVMFHSFDACDAICFGGTNTYKISGVTLHNVNARSCKRVFDFTSTEGVSIVGGHITCDAVGGSTTAIASSHAILITDSNRVSITGTRIENAVTGVKLTAGADDRTYGNTCTGISFKNVTTAAQIGEGYGNSFINCDIDATCTTGYLLDDNILQNRNMIFGGENRASTALTDNSDYEGDAGTGLVYFDPNEAKYRINRSFAGDTNFRVQNELTGNSAIATLGVVTDQYSGTLSASEATDKIEMKASGQQFEVGTSSDHPVELVVNNTVVIETVKNSYGVGSAYDIKIGNGKWNGGHLIMGNFHFWIDSSGDFRAHDDVPTGEGVGVIIGALDMGTHS